MASPRTYYRLTKPGIIYGNALPLVAGYFLAVYTFNIYILLAVLIGQSLVIAGSCVLNNILDRRIDAKMARTAQRALVTGEIKVMPAFVYGSILLIGGLTMLLFFVNILTALVGLIGAVLYIAAYGWGKRHTTYGTLIGAVPGALPPVAGYTAVTLQLDLTALLLFLVLVFWQLAHFYAIGLFRLKDYAAAGLHIMPLQKSARVVRQRINIYVVAFGVSGLALWLVAPVGIVYLAAISLMTAYWLYKGRLKKKLPDEKWGRLMFGQSLLALLVVCTALSIGRHLP